MTQDQQVRRLMSMIKNGMPLSIASAKAGMSVPTRDTSVRFFTKNLILRAESEQSQNGGPPMSMSVAEMKECHPGYSAIDFLEDVKGVCPRAGIQFDDDIFNELVA